ncbi:MAG: M36 family metallopeptidase [Ferruginibacter sp.]
MKKQLLLVTMILCSFLLKAQNVDNAAAMQLVFKNSDAIGLAREDLGNTIVSSAYYNEASETKMVYLLQTYKGLPVYNQMLVLAFKNEKLISNAGTLLIEIDKMANNGAPVASVSAPNAINAAFAAAKIALPGNSLRLVSSTENGRKQDFGILKGVTENVTAELLWVPVNNQQNIKLAWQIQVVPKGKADWWNIQVDAITGVILDKINLTVYEGHNHKTLDKLGTYYPVSPSNLFFNQTNNTNNFTPPPTVTNASYRVVPLYVESPNHGAITVVNEPWLGAGAGNNAITNGWHFDGTTNYDITRGNNVFAYLDVLNNNTPGATSNWPDTSTTANPNLSFNFPPDFSQQPAATANKKFAVANLFYWNNLMHDVTYQYGFNEVSGNYQADNLGRGGNGNDYVLAEAQDGGGTNNANFNAGVDGARGRMQMYLWSPVGSTTTLHVNAPTALIGNYTAVESAFSPNNLLANVGPVTGQVVYFNDASGGTHDACTGAPTNSLTGKIALINRGGCNFTIKVLAAQTAGAIAVIMVNNASGAPIPMGGADNSITIPAVMVSDIDGALFAANLAAGLNVTLSGTPAGTINLDGDLDNGVVSHEYGHGVSIRLTGGPLNSSCLNNAEQGGEGWSDFLGLMMTTNWATALLTDGGLRRGIGTYAGGEPITGGGIRPYPYSTNMTINPFTYANLPTAIVPHGVGAIWCTVLWDMTWDIIQQENSINPNLYNSTGTGGNIIAMKIVMEGLRLQNCSPGFMDSRNAILTADQNLYGGAHYCTIWNAFARRGMGYSASQGSSASVTDGTPAFNLPPGPTISTQPVNVSVCTGTNTSFTVAASGATNLTYQWQISTNGGVNWNGLSNSAPYSGVTTATLTITGVTAGLNNNRYRVVLNSGCIAPTTVNSTGAILTIATSTPNITSQPANTTVCSGSNATFTVVASGVSLTYNWQVSTDGGGTWNNVSPVATTATLTLTGVTIGMNNNQYRAVVTGNCGAPASINSNGGVLTVTTAGLAITSQPSATTVCAGANASFTVAATGSSITYNWQVSTDGGATWNNMSPVVTTSTLTITGVTGAMNNNQYRCQLASTGTCSGSATSSPATLTVNSLPAITTQPVNSIICTGSNTSFTSAGTGTGISYQWQVSTTGCSGTFVNLANGAPYSGVNTTTLNITAAAAGMNGYAYKVIVSGTCAPSVLSNCVSLSVNAAATITSQPANTTVCPGTTANFSATATGVGVTYQWQVSTNGGGTWTDITGANGATLAVTAVTAGMNNNQYRVVVFSCGPTGVNSNGAVLTVSVPSVISTQPANVAVCAGGNVSFSVAGVALTAYQWQLSTNGGTTWTNITGANTSTYAITGVTVAMNGNQYRAVVNGLCVTGLNSNAATLTLNTPVQVTTQPANTQVCVGASAQITIVATGTTITYQWQESINGGTFQNISNAAPYSGVTTATLTINPATLNLNGRQYRVIASGVPCGAVTSNTATLTVNILPVPVLTVASYPGITPYLRTGLYVTVSPPGTYSYQWFKNNVLIPSRTASFFDASVDDFGDYQVTVMDVNTGCSNTTNRVTLRDSASNILFIIPNPSSGLFTVSYHTITTGVVRMLNVYDAKGARVYSSAYNISRFYERMEVNLKNAASGVYMVELVDGKGARIATGKVVIKH